MVTEFAFFLHEIAKMPMYSVDDVVLLTPPLSTSPSYIAASRKIQNYKQIIDDFNRGLKRIRANGIYNQILKDYKVDKIH